MKDTTLEQKIIALCHDIAVLADKDHRKIVTAESCTGGLISAYLTELPGSSAYVEGGFVTYSNQMKQHALNVPAFLLEKYGAVSEEVATAMVQGALKRSSFATHAVAVTGIAGPTGETAAKPVGLVYIAAQKVNQSAILQKHNFTGDRNNIRLQTVLQALKLLKSL